MIACRVRPFVIRLLLQVLLTVPLFLANSMLFAQGTAATVTGFVTDSSGATLPDATVTYTNVATGVVSKVNTNSEGLYRVPGLLPGTYKAIVSMKGFKTSVQEGIDLQIEAQVTLNYTLGVGAASDVVTINANSSILETTSPTVSQVIEGRQVEDTPLNGRNTMNLVALTPGVVAQGGTNGAASNNTDGGAFTNANSFGNYSIAGGLAAQSAVYLDGVPLNGSLSNLVPFIITQDAVQEFRVQTSVVNAQYGAFGGGVISFGTKSGTNKIHGSVYEYFRNTIFNANAFFNNLHGIARPEFNQNQFGATIGASIMKNKAFVFVSYEGYRLAQGVVNTGRVPTPAELDGDFTADPKVINPVPTLGPQVAPGVYAFAQYHQAECGGVLNKFCIGSAVNPGDAVADPTAIYMANTLHYFPTPNVTNGGASVNYLANGKANAYSGQETIRFDYNVTEKQKLFARVTRFDRTQDPTQFFNNPTGPHAFTGVGSTTTQYAAGDVITLSPTSVLDVRISYLRYFSYLIPATTNFNLGSLDGSSQAGFWNGASNKLTPFFPDVLITNNTTYPYTGLDQFAQQPLNNYTVYGNYSKVLGRHSINAGGEFRQGEQYIFNQPFFDGAFVFAGTSTSCIPAATPGTATFNDAAHTILKKYCGPVGGPPTNLVIPASGATPVADFVSGQFATGVNGFVTQAVPSVLSHYAGLFVNDTFTVSAKLVITAGVRYELPGSFYEKNNRNNVLIPGLANPLVLVATPAYPNRGDLVAHHALFSPRVGFSFSPYPGTNLRAGYSLAYISQTVGLSNPPALSSINGPTTFIPASYQLCAPLGFTVGTSCNAPGSVANTTILSASAGRAGYLANPREFYGQTITGRDPFGGFPYLQQWNANVQQSFGPSAVMQLAYLGARGDHLVINNTFNINQIPDNAPIGPTSQASRPYPEYQNVNLSDPFFGDTYYHSFQATFTKRFSSGGTLLANYSWSKFLGTAESTGSPVESHSQGVIQDYNNIKAERSYVSFDVPQRLVVSYILDLPFGQGKHFLANAGNVVNAIVGGWDATGINQFQSGFPLALVSSPTPVSAAFGGGTPRPNFVAGCHQKARIGYVLSAQEQSSTFNTACFSAPAGGGVASTYFGNQPRTSGILRTQGVDNWDFSVGKVTKIHDNVSLTFRAEAFNLTNRVQFGDPGLTVGSATFGVLTTQANQPRSFQFSLRANY